MDNYKMQSVTIRVFISGTEISELKSVIIEPLKPMLPEPEEKSVELANGDILLRQGRLLIELKKTEIRPEFLGKMMSTADRFTLIGTGYRYPRGKQLPRKKRLRKKWKKKYGVDIRYNNVQFVSE